MTIRRRRLLAGLRLFLLYGLLCALILAVGLLRRAAHEAGAGLGDLPGNDSALPLLGVTVHLAEDEAAAPGQQLAALTAAGFGWARQRFDWGQIEPAPGVFDWRRADAAVDAILDAGLVPVALLDGSPTWARAAQDRPPTDNALAPPADPSTFARFAAAFATRYGDRLRFYQIWDEPNLAPHWGNRLVEPVAYAQLLKAASQAIRAADGDAVIAAAALAPTADRGHTAVDEVYFLQRLVAAGAAPFFDVVALQPFGFGRSAGDTRQDRSVLNFQRAAWVRRALVAAGLGDKPIWATRFGWNRTPNAVWGAVTPTTQATETAAALHLAAAQWPWLTALGWPVDRPAAPPGDPLWGFALYDDEGEASPVLAAFAAWSATAGAVVQTPPSPAVLPWLLLAAVGGLVAWRGFAAARLLPWRGWRAAFRRQPWPWQAVVWAALLVVYYFATWPPLVGLSWLAWALLCLAQPHVGLWVAAMLLPFTFQHKELILANGVLAVPPAAAATACLAPAVLLRFVRPSPRHLDRLDWAVLALPGIALLSASGAWHLPGYAHGVVEMVVVPLGLWLAVRVLATDARRRQQVALALLAGGLLVAVWGVVAWLRGEGVEVDGVRRLVGPHFSPNHSALYLLRTLFLGLGLALALHHRARWALGLATALVLLALLLTGSRGALLLGLPAGGVVFAWLAMRRRVAGGGWPWRAGLWLLGAGGLLLAVTVAWLPGRLANLATVASRLELWDAARRLWGEHLWAGVGPGGFVWGYPAYLATGAALEPNHLHAHNLWLELGTTWGVVGIAWFGVLLYLFFARLRVSLPTPDAWLRAGLLAALAAAAAHAQVDAFFTLADLAAWNAVALALLVVPEIIIPQR